MISMRLSEAGRVTGAVLRGADAGFVGVSTDSRTLPDGALFCALHGPNFDGHEYCAAAAQRGAVGVLLEREVDTQLPALIVPDTQQALGALARAWRRRFAIPVVGITGSNGKTTVKQMLASILGVDAPVLATSGNLNNEIGVPQTLFQLDRTHRYAVVEMGASQLGDIATLAAMAEPDVGVITLCAPAHLEGFGTIEQVARTKGEMYAALPADGTAVINLDDDFAAYWRKIAGERQVLTFGFGAAADIHASAIETRGPGQGMRFTLHTPAGTAAIALPFDGRHNVANALAAAAAAIALDVPLDAIRQGLEVASNVGGRLRVCTGIRGAQIIDDTYNANPASLRAALCVLATAAGEKWVVLGDMGELGPEAREMHEQLGREARELGIDRLYALGPLAAAAARGFGARGQSYTDIDVLNDALAAALDSNVTVLVKGSRFMRMERVTAALGGEHETC